MYPPFVMHRRAAVEAVNGWDTSFITSQDSDLSMRLLKAGYSLYRHPSSFGEDAQTQHPCTVVENGTPIRLLAHQSAAQAPTSCEMARILTRAWGRCHPGLVPHRFSILERSTDGIRTGFTAVRNPCCPLRKGFLFDRWRPGLPPSSSHQFFPRVDGRLGQKRSVFQRPCLNTRSQ